MSLDLDGALWRFALAFYAQPGVADACLTLQDKAGVDVVQLLAVLYADAVLAKPLSSKEITTLQRDAEPWRTATVLPLRQIRRALKPSRPGFPEERNILRDQVKAAELLAEQIQCGLIEQWLRDRNCESGLPLAQAVEELRKPAGLAPERDEVAIACAVAVLERAITSWTRDEPMGSKLR